MDLNTEFGTRVVVHSKQLEWTPSPMPGVDRPMSDSFGGEEANVPDGVFQGEHGHLPHPNPPAV